MMLAHTSPEQLADQSFNLGSNMQSGWSPALNSATIRTVSSFTDPL